jgi:BirA family transcriptional regulator, biotin operon repressor / biotin---[acetyl-CoA-carboxylase] ligase
MRQPDTLPQDFAEAFAAARERLGPFAARVLFFDEIGSTNDVAAALAAGGSGEDSVVIAETQTAGRGRRGRRWFSPPGSGLYVSAVLAPHRSTDPVRATSLLTLAAGVALAEAIESTTGLGPDIKWPNDLLVARRKLGGILAEGVSISGSDAQLLRVVLGFGINVNPAAYPTDLRTAATSLETELGRPIDRALVCAECLVALRRRYEDLLAGRFDAILDDWRRRAPGSQGARVRWDDATGTQRGISAGVDESGALLVQSGDALHRLAAGEIFWD